MEVEVEDRDLGVGPGVFGIVDHFHHFHFHFLLRDPLPCFRSANTGPWLVCSRTRVNGPQKSVVMTTRVNLDRIGDDGSASPLSVSWPWPKPLSLEQA